MSIFKIAAGPKISLYEEKITKLTKEVFEEFKNQEKERKAWNLRDNNQVVTLTFVLRHYIMWRLKILIKDSDKFAIAMNEMCEYQNDIVNDQNFKTR